MQRFFLKLFFFFFFHLVSSFGTDSCAEILVKVSSNSGANFHVVGGFIGNTPVTCTREEGLWLFVFTLIVLYKRRREYVDHIFSHYSFTRQNWKNSEKKKDTFGISCWKCLDWRGCCYFFVLIREITRWLLFGDMLPHLGFFVNFF